MSTVRSRLVDLLLTDAINSQRTNDVLRETLVASLVKRASDMEPTEILDAISKISSISTIGQYERIANLLSSVDSPQSDSQDGPDY